jgi:hypothetical protein
MPGSADNPIRLDPWTHIKEVHWGTFEYLAFSVVLGVGVPASDFFAACGSPSPPAGAFASGWSTGYTYPFTQISEPLGYRNGEWVSAPQATVTGLPFSDSVSFDPGTVTQKTGFQDASRIRPSSGGSAGIPVPGLSDEFTTDTTPRGEIVSVAMDGTVYCADVPPTGDGQGELGADTINGGVPVEGLGGGPSILSRVSVANFSAAGTFTVQRNEIIEGSTFNMPKVMWALFQRN